MHPSEDVPYPEAPSGTCSQPHKCIIKERTLSVGETTHISLPVELIARSNILEPPGFTSQMLLEFRIIAFPLTKAACRKTPFLGNYPQHLPFIVYDHVELLHE